jgi:hypothetical protein
MSLAKQIRDAQAAVDAWPRWMRDAAAHDAALLTPAVFERAARAYATVEALRDEPPPPPVRA